MSNNQIVIDTLIQKRDTLISERDKMVKQFQNQIQEIEEALDQLSGGASWAKPTETVYDDEHPEYIKQSKEEI